MYLPRHPTNRTVSNRSPRWPLAYLQHNVLSRPAASMHPMSAIASCRHVSPQPCRVAERRTAGQSQLGGTQVLLQYFNPLISLCRPHADLGSPAISPNPTCPENNHLEPWIASLSKSFSCHFAYAPVLALYLLSPLPLSALNCRCTSSALNLILWVFKYGPCWTAWASTFGCVDYCACNSCVATVLATVPRSLMSA